MKKIYFILNCFIFLQIEMYSTHNKSGEITYRPAYGSTNPFEYEIIVTTYTKYIINKPNGNTDRCELTVDFGDGTNGIVLRVNGPAIACITADGEMISNDCRKNIYVTTHTFPGWNYNYIIRVEDPNRNSGTMNIPDAENTSFSISALLKIHPFLGPNTTAQYLNNPIVNGCVGECFSFNSVFFDPDGDSLSYELEPCAANGMPILGYTYPGTPSTFTLDHRGTINWCAPPGIGRYSILVRVREWRLLSGNRYEIGNTGRDMQFDIEPCSGNSLELSNLRDTTIIAGTTLIVPVSATENNAFINIAAMGAPLTALINPPLANFSTTDGIGIANAVFEWQTSESHARKQPYLVVFKATNNQITQRTSYQAMNITIVSTLSVPDDKFSSAINISPNPFGSYFEIKIPQTCRQIEVFDVLGKKVLDKNNLEGLKECTIDAIFFNSGVYFVKFTSADSHVAVRKIIKG